MLNKANQELLEEFKKKHPEYGDVTSEQVNAQIKEIGNDFDVDPTTERNYNDALNKALTEEEEL